MDVEWDNETINKFYNYLFELINYEKCLELEKDIRIETGTESVLNINSQLNENANNKINICTYKFKKNEDDIVGEILDNEKQEENIKNSIPLLTKKAFIIYTNVIDKAKSEGTNSINLETDHFLRTDIFKLVFNKYIIYNTKVKIKEIHCKNTKNIVSLANPLNIKDYDLNKINSETIANLMNNNVGIQTNFMGKECMKLIYDELIFIEYNNQFNEFSREYRNIRTDFYCWTYISSLDREKQKGLLKLLKELSLIPYELNKKANLSLQVCTLFQFLYFCPNKSFLKKHSEGGYGKLDNGKKITCIYIPLVHSNNDIEIKIYNNEDNLNEPNKINNNDTNTNLLNKMDNTPIKIIKPESDSLIFLQTRNISYEIPKTKNKFFIVNLWISGPASLEKKL
ncbi:conserved Plasmodium protein, unknown function [Plasmodium gallinaceum]|uniref:Uncharacterized protein n=1 Tax=Plasmodium gallinaceum TaxID=5849 RepID=A0A1J1GTL6_PLAGA|nr:conserved Plasmodium protein, unknown function [Plasmodium gallinaceum]CRG94646.1 conserved Plasmodium protein, unknown function [Plasmodium gallinaceum]